MKSYWISKNLNHFSIKNRKRRSNIVIYSRIYMKGFRIYYSLRTIWSNKLNNITSSVNHFKLFMNNFLSIWMKSWMSRNKIKSIKSRILLTRCSHFHSKFLKSLLNNYSISAIRIVLIYLNRISISRSMKIEIKYD